MKPASERQRKIRKRRLELEKGMQCPACHVAVPGKYTREWLRRHIDSKHRGTEWVAWAHVTRKPGKHFNDV